MRVPWQLISFPTKCRCGKVFVLFLKVIQWDLLPTNGKPAITEKRIYLLNAPFHCHTPAFTCGWCQHPETLRYPLEIRPSPSPLGAGDSHCFWDTLWASPLDLRHTNFPPPQSFLDHPTWAFGGSAGSGRLVLCLSHQRWRSYFLYPLLVSKILLLVPFFLILLILWA